MSLLGITRSAAPERCGTCVELPQAGHGIVAQHAAAVGLALFGHNYLILALAYERLIKRSWRLGSKAPAPWSWRAIR